MFSISDGTLVETGLSKKIKIYNPLFRINSVSDAREKIALSKKCIPMPDIIAWLSYRRWN